MAIKRKNCTVLDLLQEWQPSCQKADPEYVATDLRKWNLPNSGMSYKLPLIARTTPNSELLMKAAKGGLSKLIAEDSASKYERSFWMFEPVQSHNVVDNEFIGTQSFRKSEKISRNRLEPKTLALKSQEAFSVFGYGKRSIMLAKHTFIHIISI